MHLPIESIAVVYSHFGLIVLIACNKATCISMVGNIHSKFPVITAFVTITTRALNITERTLCSLDKKIKTHNTLDCEYVLQLW